jgi:hypothetical protein
MSLTKVTYSMISGAVVNVLDYGADPTGVANSQPAIQAALNTGANVFLPRGNYKITTTLEFTSTDQVFFGENGNALNATTSNNPTAAVGMSQIFTQSAILMFSCNDQQGVSIRDIVFNGCAIATGGIDCTGSGAGPGIAFGMVFNNVGINAVAGFALNTNLAVDGQFYNINIQGYDYLSNIVTTRGISCGATNNNFYGCRVEGCTNGAFIIGTINHFFGCTFANPTGTNIKIGGNISQLSFNGCYLENGVTIYSNSSFAYGCVDFVNCFIQNANVSNLIDLTNAASGSQVNFIGGRFHETSGSNNITAPSGVSVNCINVGQTMPTFSGAGSFSLQSNSNIFANEPRAIFPGYVAVDGSTAQIHAGVGTPEGAVTAPIGSIFMREDGGAGTSFYVKQSGSGNTGWVGK